MLTAGWGSQPASCLCLTSVGREFVQLLEALVGKRVRVLSEEEENDEAFVRVLDFDERRTLPL